MSKKIYLFSLVLLALAFTACSETEETGKYDNWQARNEAFIDSIANAHANTATPVSYTHLDVYKRQESTLSTLANTSHALAAA